MAKTSVPEGGHRSLRDFLQARVIFLTGATGFLGKSLLEKLLRDVPELPRVYVLVRPGRKADGSPLPPAERLRKEIFETAICARLRALHGERFQAFIAEKVVAVPGEITREDFGLAPEMLARVRADVDTVIHGAASVLFDERIDHAIETNTLAARRAVLFTRSLTKPALLTLVSTAYVNGSRSGRILEELPPPGSSPARLMGRSDAPALEVEREIREMGAATRAAHARAASETLARSFRAEAEKERTGGEPLENLVAEARERWLVRELVREGMRRARRLGWHDVYTFTKAMGEVLATEARGELPVAIVRPSIIESSFSEPEPGWINGLKVADPLMAAYAKGRLPDFPVKREVVLDLVPVDFVSNAILASLERLDRQNGLVVYHVATGARNPVRAGQVYELMQSYYRRHPMRDKKGEPIRTPDWKFPSARRFRAKYRYGVGVPLKTLARTVAATPFLPWPPRLHDKLRRTSEGVARLLYYTDLYAAYTNLDCAYDSTNTKRLYDELSPADQKTFNFDVEAIDWPKYIQDIHLTGLDRHVLRFGSGDSPRRRGASSRKSMSTEDLNTLPDLARMSAERFADKVALQMRRNDAWVRLTYADLLKRAGLVGALWRSLGLKRGSRVVFIAENQPEWAVAYWAAQAVGATVVPIDTHTPHAEMMQILEFTEAAAVVASDTTYPTLPKAMKASPIPIWNLNDGGMPFAERGGPAPAAPAAAEVRWEELSPDDVASIIFTSGPAVEPRGAMLTHRNFLANLLSLSEVLRSYETDRFVSILPLHHALEFTGGLLMPLMSGAMVTYTSSLKSKVLLDAMAETGATALLAVPRIFELLLERLKRGPEGSRLKPGERSPELVSFVNRMRLLVSGGAPLDISIYEAFAAIGTPIHEGYGLTETSPILTVNPLWGIRARSVGKPLPGVELRLDQPDATGEGEIVVRGPNVMKGYFKNPASTAKMLRQGWLYTGDLGRLDADGYLSITGRSKELIVTGAGKNVWPEEIELFYSGIEGVEELAVFGMRPPGATRETVHLGLYATGDRDKVLARVHAISHERPTYQRVTQVHFWDRPLPKGADGRIARKALREAALEELRAEQARPAQKAEPRAKDQAWWERDALLILTRIAGREAHEPVTRREALSALFDSLQSVELVAALETRFGTTLTEEDAAALATVADVLDKVKLAVGDRPETDFAVAAPAEEGDYWTKLIAQTPLAPSPVNGRSLEASASLQPLQALFLAASAATLKGAFRLSVRGADKLPLDRPFIVAANHSSHLDSAAILAALRGSVKRVHILGARDYFFDTPGKAWVFRNFLNVVPFDRDKNFAEGLVSCRQVLKPREPVLIFPEGTRSPTGRLQPFKVGLGILALELGVPVVPARIRGTYEALPKGASWPRLHRIDVAFGEPVSMAPYQARRGGGNSYELYRDVVNEIRLRMERLFDEG